MRVAAVLLISFVTFGAGTATAGTPARGSVHIETKTETLGEVNGKAAVIHYPVFSGLSPDVLARVQEVAGLKAVTTGEGSLSEWKEEISGWLTEVNYEVGYNRNGLLSLTYSVDGMGAYPDTITTDVVVDLTTGKAVTAPDLFRKASLAELAAKVDRMRAAAVERAFKEGLETLKNQPDSVDPMTEEDLNSILEEPRQKRIQVSDLDRFRLGEHGVTFVYDFGFPHVIQALEPSGEYFLSYEDLKPYIDPAGPLGTATQKGRH